MWHRLSIKWQLVLFMVLVVSLVEISTLYTVHGLQNTQNKENAIAQVEIITKSLNNDFLKVILNPSTDSFADVKSRLAAFKILNGMLLLNDVNKTVYQNGSIESLKKQMPTLHSNSSFFNDTSVFVKKPLMMDGYTYGYTLFDIDLRDYKKQQQDTTLSILLIFPFALILGFILSLFLGANYTKPFTQLLNAMQKSDPSNNHISLVETNLRMKFRSFFLDTTI